MLITEIKHGIPNNSKYGQTTCYMYGFDWKLATPDPVVDHHVPLLFNGHNRKVYLISDKANYHVV